MSAVKDVYLEIIERLESALDHYRFQCHVAFRRDYNQVEHYHIQPIDNYDNKLVDVVIIDFDCIALYMYVGDKMTCAQRCDFYSIDELGDAIEQLVDLVDTFLRK